MRRDRRGEERQREERGETEGEQGKRREEGGERGRGEGKRREGRNGRNRGKSGRKDRRGHGVVEKEEESEQVVV